MLRFLLTATIYFIGFELEANEQQQELEAAGMQLAIAAGCRANYGEYELFEIAFDRFSELAKKADPPITTEELSEILFILEAALVALSAYSLVATAALDMLAMSLTFELKDCNPVPKLSINSGPTFA